MASTFTNLLVHFIFSTKDRCPLITPSLETPLHGYLGGIIAKKCGLALEIGGIADHVHLVVKLKPDVSVSEAVRLIKCNSSKWVNDQRPASGRFEWQTGYGAFSVSESQLPALGEYVRNQKAHHRTMTFQEEYVQFLERHGIEYDPRYIWD